MSTIQFERAVKKLLDEYGDSVTKDLNESLVAAGKEARKRLRADTTFSQTDEYRSGWNTVIEDKRVGATKVIVANTGKHGALAHLLEHGHPIRNGSGKTYGNVEGKPHIAPIEEAVNEYLINEVERRLKG